MATIKDDVDAEQKEIMLSDARQSPAITAESPTAKEAVEMKELTTTTIAPSVETAASVPANTHIEVAVKQLDRAPSNPRLTNRLPITITFQKLQMIVVTKKPGMIQRLRGQTEVVKSTIIDGVAGSVRPGELIAIMGSSGAGKTTLLNILSGRSNEFTGDVLLNGRKATRILLKNSAFVQQSDLFLQGSDGSRTLDVPSFDAYSCDRRGTR